MKRDDLATPRGIDHDYNFITGIERKLDRAERDAGERGIVLGDAGDRARPPKGKSEIPNVQRAIQSCGVIVGRAPKGMMREKQNNTSWSPKYGSMRKHSTSLRPANQINRLKCLNWAIEWIPPSGRKSVSKILETTPISEAYTTHILSTSSLSKKEKQRLRLFSNRKPPTPAAPSPPPTSTTPTSPTTYTNPTANSSTSTLYFYLHRPLTPSPTPVLIPLPPQTSLSTILPTRLVLEFPTIYILPHPPSSLPATFTLEEDFLRSEKNEREIDAELMREVGSLGGGKVGRCGEEGKGKEGKEDGDVNKERLMEVLEKDLSWIAGHVLV